MPKGRPPKVKPEETKPKEPEFVAPNKRWIKVGGVSKLPGLRDPRDGFPWFISDAMLTNPMGENLQGVLDWLTEHGYKIEVAFTAGMHGVIIVEKVE